MALYVQRLPDSVLLNRMIQRALNLYTSTPDYLISTDFADELGTVLRGVTLECKYVVAPKQVLSDNTALTMVT